MQQVILYTKRFQLNFDNSDNVQIDLTELIEELYNEYTFLDPHPVITIENGWQLVTFKLSKKELRKNIGFR
jgi:hypothetical protein